MTHRPLRKYVFMSCLDLLSSNYGLCFCYLSGTMEKSLALYVKSTFFFQVWWRNQILSLKFIAYIPISSYETRKKKWNNYHLVENIESVFSFIWIYQHLCSSSLVSVNYRGLQCGTEDNILPIEIFIDQGSSKLKLGSFNWHSARPTNILIYLLCFYLPVSRSDSQLLFILYGCRYPACEWMFFAA